MMSLTRRPKCWQGYAALLPVKTVGVMGDGRTYEYFVAPRGSSTR